MEDETILGDIPQYNTESVSLVIEGKPVECIVIQIPIDDLDAYLINQKDFVLISLEDENESVVITLSDMQKYFEFLSDKGISEMETIPFVVDTFSGKVLEPNIAEDANFANLLISTIGFPLELEIDDKIIIVTVLQFPYNLVEVFLSEEGIFSLLNGAIKVDNAQLRELYLSYKKVVKSDVNILNLAFDETSLKGFVVEKIVGHESYYEYYGFSEKENTGFIRCFYFFNFVFV